MNSSFSSSIPALQIAWDSTSMGAFKECARKYYYSIILGWQPRETSVHLTFGLLYHSAMEQYHRLRAQGQDHAQALRTVTRQALIATWNPTLNRPWTSDHKNKNRLTLIRSIIWYLQQFRDDSITTLVQANGQPAVELSFRFATGHVSPDGSPYLFCGHLDRIGILEGLTYGCDYKTTSWALSAEFFQKYSPDNQMSTYSFAGKVIFHQPIKGIIIDAAQVLVNYTRFQRGFAPRSDDQLDEWYDQWGWWVKMAEGMARAGQEKNYPMNDKSCTHFGGCPFQKICGQDPAVRDMWLKANFVKRVWNPLQVRGDI